MLGSDQDKDDNDKEKWLNKWHCMYSRQIISPLSIYFSRQLQLAVIQIGKRVYTSCAIINGRLIS
jgi:hypothetical protein